MRDSICSRRSSSATDFSSRRSAFSSVMKMACAGIESGRSAALEREVHAGPYRAVRGVVRSEIREPVSARRSGRSSRGSPSRYSSAAGPWTRSRCSRAQRVRHRGDDVRGREAEIDVEPHPAPPLHGLPVPPAEHGDLALDQLRVRENHGLPVPRLDGGVTPADLEHLAGDVSHLDPVTHVNAVVGLQASPLRMLRECPAATDR